MKRVTRTSVVINGVSLFDVLVLIYVIVEVCNYAAGAGMVSFGMSP